MTTHNSKIYLILASIYSGKLSVVDFTVSLTSEFAKAKKYNAINPTLYQKIHDIKAYAIGGILNYEKYAFAASYGNWGQSMNTYVNDVYNKADAHFYTAGISYTANKYGVSLTYMDTSRMKSKMFTASLGAEYNLAPGLVPYAEGNIFRYKPYHIAVYQSTSGSTLASKNKGNVVLIGTKVNF